MALTPSLDLVANHGHIQSIPNLIDVPSRTVTLGYAILCPRHHSRIRGWWHLGLATINEAKNDMPQWLKNLLRDSSNTSGLFYLDSRPNPILAPQHFIKGKPAGHWIMGLLIDSKGKYSKTRLCVMISTGADFKTVVVRVRGMLGLGIDSLEAMEARFVSDNIGVVSGGFHNYRSETLEQAARMYSVVFYDDDDSDENPPSTIGGLRSSGGNSHIL